MIIGRGDIAKAIQDRDGFTFFCAGVSNREPLTDRAKQKELNRIWRSDKTKMFVYFSTLSIYYNAGEYQFHKLDMENLVKRSFDNYCIVRIGNITWGDNPNTIINSFRSKLLNNEKIEIQDTYRYLVDADELNHWLGKIPPTGKHEFNITGRLVTPEEILNEIKAGKI